MNLTQILHRNIQQRPNRQAVYFQGQSWTYQEFGERVARMAGAFSNLGIKDGSRVALLSMNSSRYLEYLFSVPWAGGAINPVNIRWSAAEVAYSLNDSNTRILIVDEAFASKVPEIRKLAPQLDHVIYAGDGTCPEGFLDYETLLAEAEAIDDVYRCRDDLAGIFYTGGTTGFPKGVMLSHTNLMSFALSNTLLSGIPHQPRMLHCAPLFHVAGLGVLLMSFVLGGTQIVVPAFDSTVVAQVAKEQSITDMLLVPTMVQMLLDSPGFDSADFSSLKHIVYGASPMPLGTLNKAIGCLPKIEFIQGYGMTECGLISMNPASVHSSVTREKGRISSAGISGPVQQVQIVDEQGQVLPSGEVGEITVRGPNVMLGYWDKPELTEKAIVNGWLHTGDGGYLDDEGYIHVVDRVKDMIISGGENIYSSEVETVITQYPGVAQCAVIGIPSDEWGEAVHAVIVPSPGKDAASTLSLDGLREFCKSKIAGYKCARSISLVDALPVSGAGKILKTELRKPFWEGRDKQVS